MSIDKNKENATDSTSSGEKSQTDDDKKNAFQSGTFDHTVKQDDSKEEDEQNFKSTKSES